MALPLFPPIIPSRNMYKGHMDKAKGGRFEDEVKMEAAVLEQ